MYILVGRARIRLLVILSLKTSHIAYEEFLLLKALNPGNRYQIKAVSTMGKRFLPGWWPIPLQLWPRIWKLVLEEKQQHRCWEMIANFFTPQKITHIVTNSHMDYNTFTQTQSKQKRPNFFQMIPFPSGLAIKELKVPLAWLALIFAFAGPDLEHPNCLLCLVQFYSWGWAGFQHEYLNK